MSNTIKILFLFLLINNTLLAKPILENKRIGISMGIANSTNPKNYIENDNNIKIIGFNSKFDKYIKRKYSYGFITNIQMTMNNISDELIWEFIPSFTTHLKKDLDAYFGIGYSFSKLNKQQDDGISTLIGIEHKIDKNYSISCEYNYTDYSISPLNKITLSINFRF